MINLIDSIYLCSYVRILFLTVYSCMCCLCMNYDDCTIYMIIADIGANAGGTLGKDWRVRFSFVFFCK